MPNRITTLVIGSTLAFIVAACGSGAATVSPPAAALPTSATSAGAAATVSTAAAATRISANAASESEIAAALAAAGVPNADRWAREVTEYRPYPTDDPTLARLQANLAKYNPDTATLQAILSALQP
jgi:hypothetical protein